MCFDSWKCIKIQNEFASPRSLGELTALPDLLTGFGGRSGEGKGGKGGEGIGKREGKGRSKPPSPEQKFWLRP